MCYILRCNQISQRLNRLTDLIIQQNQRSPIENGIKDLPERYIKRLRSKLKLRSPGLTSKPCSFAATRLIAPPCVLPTPFGRPVDPEV